MNEDNKINEIETKEVKKANSNKTLLIIAGVAIALILLIIGIAMSSSVTEQRHERIMNSDVGKVIEDSDRVIESNKKAVEKLEETQRQLDEFIEHYQNK